MNDSIQNDWPASLASLVREATLNAIPNGLSRYLLKRIEREIHQVARMVERLARAIRAQTLPEEADLVHLSTRCFYRTDAEYQLKKKVDRLQVLKNVRRRLLNKMMARSSCLATLD